MDDPKFDEKLVKFEGENSIVRSYKFGVLSVQNGQQEEDMWYGNGGTDDFWEFLDFLGTKIALKDWRNFRGGLDTKTDTTGVHSYYTQVLCFFFLFFSHSHSLSTASGFRNHVSCRPSAAFQRRRCPTAGEEAPSRQRCGDGVVHRRH